MFPFSGIQARRRLISTTMPARVMEQHIVGKAVTLFMFGEYGNVEFTLHSMKVCCSLPFVARVPTTSTE